MRLSVFQNLNVQEMFQEKLDFSVTVSVGQAFNCDETFHVVWQFGHNDDLRRVHEYKGCKTMPTKWDFIDDNTVNRPELDVQETHQHGRYCIEIKIYSLRIDNSVSLVVTSRGLDRYVTPPSEGNTHSTSTSTSSPTVPEIRAPGKQERRTSRVFPDSNHLRRSLKARRIMLQWKVILNLQWRHEATLCDNKNHRKHILWKLFRASPVWRSSQRKTDNGMFVCYEIQTEQFIGKQFWISSKESTRSLDIHSRAGRDAQNTDRTRSDSSIPLTTWAIRSTYELFKDTPVEQDWTHSCEETSKSHMDGPTFLYHVGSSYDYRSILEGGLIAGGKWAVKEEDKLASSLLWIRWTSRWWPLVSQTETEKWTEHSFLVWSENCSRQRFGIFYQSKSDAILLYNTMKWSKAVKMTLQARVFIKRRIRFQKKFVTFVWKNVRIQRNELWATIREVTIRFWRSRQGLSN